MLVSVNARVCFSSLSWKQLDALQSCIQSRTLSAIAVPRPKKELHTFQGLHPGTSGKRHLLHKSIRSVRVSTCIREKCSRWSTQAGTTGSRFAVLDIPFIILIIARQYGFPPPVSLIQLSRSRVALFHYHLQQQHGMPDKDLCQWL